MPGPVLLRPHQARAQAGVLDHNRRSGTLGLCRLFLLHGTPCTVLPPIKRRLLQDCFVEQEYVGMKKLDTADACDHTIGYIPEIISGIAVDRPPLHLGRMAPNSV